MRLIPSKPNTAFSKVPHLITFSDMLTPHQKIVWIMMDAVCYNRETEAVSATHLAEKLGLPARGLQRTIKELIEMGFIVKSGRLYSLETEPREDAEATGVTKQRRLTNDEKLRLELKDIWNKYKPKNAPSMQDFTPARLKTLRVYVNRFNEDEQVILRRVLDGSNANEFRRDKGWGFENIFGNGIPTEKKQTTLEKAYREGCSAKARNAAFDVDDDQCWIDWYHSKGHDHMIKVVRLEMERYAAWDHQKETAGSGVIYLYSHEGSLVHWTGKESQVGLTYLPTAK